MWNRPAGGALALALALALPGAARADEHYYVLVFGSQRSPPNPNHSHSFAVFVKATGRGPCADSYRLEAHSISWMAVDGVVRVNALLPECGRNFGLYETLRIVQDDGQRVSLWGPYQIDRDLYDRALAQIDLLESGRVQYKAVDVGRCVNRVCNCIHAVSAVEDGYRLAVLSPGWGETASYYLTLRMEPSIIDCNRRHDWVATRLGLDRYALIRRDLENPRSGLINTLLGRDPERRAAAR
jgi:hypothetical protein